MHSTEILVVDSDPTCRSRVADPLLRVGYLVDRITHDTAVAHISREDMSRYAAIVVVMTGEPSTLSDTYRLGEYVLHYLAQLCPEALPRVVVVARSSELAEAAARVGRVLIEPVTEEELLAEVRAVIL
jgi:DNA-binding response OmpR family regulator